MQILWKLINPNSNIPITGGASATSLKIRRESDGFLYDWNDSTFKASGWGSVSATLLEVDAVNLPGLYVKDISTALWNDGGYDYDATYTAAGVSLFAVNSLYVEDGVEAVIAGTVNDKIGYSLAAAYDAAKTAATQTSVNALGSPMQAGTQVTVATNNDKTGYAMTASYDITLAAINETVDTIDGKADDIIEDIYYLTHNEDGDPIQRVIPLPVNGDSCIIYDYCFDQDSGSPLASVSASAKIVSLPYDYHDKLHTGAMITGTYEASTGLISWEIVQGATVIISIQEVGVMGRVTIPNETQARIFDLME